MVAISRRVWLRRLAALIGGVAGNQLLAACGLAGQPSPTPAPPEPTASPAPTLAPAGMRPAIIRAYPDGPSTVVRTRHSGVWAGEELVPEVLRQMLAASITALTGLDDAREAWAALFRPEERIALKVNTIVGSSGWTHVPLVMAIAGCLQDAGIPAEQIIIYDRDTYELKNAGYTINEDGPGVRCCPTAGRYTPGFEVAGIPTRLSDVLLGCDALINIPILKQHMYAGISFAMKNHYGTFNNPTLFHYSTTAEAIPQLNALAPIRDRARLIVGDTLKVVFGDYWGEFEYGDSIFMSFDPVAQDAAALRLFVERKEAREENPAAYISKAEAWLKRAAELGLGTNEEANTHAVELALG